MPGEHRSRRRWGWIPIAAAALLALSACDAAPGGEAGDGPDNPPNGAPDPNPGMDPNPGPQPPPLPEFVPAEAVMPRLTASQYRNTVEDLFGPDLPATPLEQDTNPHLFYSIGASTTTLSGHGVEQYADAAFAITDVLFADPARRQALLGCTPGLTVDDACTREVLTRLGRRIYRRPLTAAEVDRWALLAQETAGTQPHQGIQTALAGMLQSSHFIYRVEQGEPDPNDVTKRRYTSFEMAQRLAFVLWNSAPDDALLDAAERGELTDDITIQAHAERMLDSPRSRIAVQDFFAQYLDLNRLSRVDRDPALYPGYTASLPAAMETELRLLVDDLVFRQEGDIRELFFARRGFVNDELAALYDIDAPGASPISFVPVDFPEDSPRAGILTLGAFLTMNAHPTETSPTLRGKYIRERLLCQTVPAPPDDIDLNLDPGEGDAPTLRERLEQHRNDPACSGCHAFIDPPGFLFEKYDSIGRFRTEVDGHAPDTSGNLDGIELDGAEDLATLLSEDPRVPACMVRQLYRHANGRLEARSEERAIRALEEDFAASGYQFRTLLMALVLSEGFRTVSAQEAMP